LQKHGQYESFHVSIIVTVTIPEQLSCISRERLEYAGFMAFSSRKSTDLPSGQLSLTYLLKRNVFRTLRLLVASHSRELAMNVTNLILITAIALLIAATAYWFQTEGGELLEQMRQSDRKPFMMNHRSW
jgi:hypothetical protein